MIVLNTLAVLALILCVVDAIQSHRFAERAASNAAVLRSHAETFKDHASQLAIDKTYREGLYQALYGADGLSGIVGRIRSLEDLAHGDRFDDGSVGLTERVDRLERSAGDQLDDDQVVAGDAADALLDDAVKRLTALFQSRNPGASIDSINVVAIVGSSIPGVCLCDQITVSEPTAGGAN